MQDANQAQCTTSLRRVGFGTYKVADIVRRSMYGSGMTGINDPGRADVWAYRAGKAVMVEVKFGAENFMFDQWSEGQRSWARDYCLAEPYNTEYWIWLTIGQNPPHWSPDKYMPKRTWLVHYHDMLYIESLLAPYQATLPYLARKHMRIEVQEQKLDAVHLLKRLEIYWGGSGQWHIPVSHPFRQMYIDIPQPAMYTSILPLPEEEWLFGKVPA